jgi:hypothetical protein
MFGFGKKKTDGIEKITDLWMSASLMLVDTDDLTRNPEKYRIALAYFFGPTDANGRQAGLSQEEIMKTFLKCLARHLDLDAAGVKHAYQTLYDISADMKYVKLMRTGIETLENWMQTRDSGGPAMLSCLLIGK